MVRYNSSQSGVALLMALGILALLSILGVAFSTSMRVMERTTRDFVYEMQARYLAEGGIEYAVAKLKEDARNNFVFSGIDKVENDDEISIPSSELPSDTAITIRIIDTARQVNIDNANERLLGCIPKIGYNPDPTIKSLAEYIVDKRNELKNRNINFLTKQSICLSDKIGKDTFNAIKEYITADTYIDPNVQNEIGDLQERSAININTLIGAIDYPINTQQKEYEILEGILMRVASVGTTTARSVITTLKNNLQKPIESWEEFDNVIDNTGISNSAKNNIKMMFNPNIKKPHGNNGTKGIPTEFCFHSGGVYEIKIISTITKSNQTLARKTINAIIKIFDLWNQTTTQQFWGEDIDNNGILDSGEDVNKNGELDIPNYTYNKVTGLDSCPVRFDDNWNGTTTTEKSYNSSTSYYIIQGSLKIGYWEEFSRSNSSDISPWIEKKILQDEKTSFNEVADMPQWGEIILGENNPVWQFDNCTATILAMERKNHANGGDYSPNGEYNDVDETGWFYFRYLTPGNEDYCTQIYYAREFDWWNKWIRDISPPRAPFMYTIKPDFKNEWKPADGKPGWDEAIVFFNTKLYRVVQHEDYLELYMISGSNTTQISSPIIYGTYNNRLDSGWIKLRTGTWKPGNLAGDIDSLGGTHWDNLRIIPDKGEYTSAPSNQAYNSLVLSEPVEWGTVWGTITKPDSNENPDDVDVKIEIPIGGKKMDLTSGISILSENSSSIQYKLYFYSNYNSNTNKYLKIPVLEDVWITYLPRTKILYWKEGAEE